MIFGIEGASFDHGAHVSDAVAAQLGAVADAVLAEVSG